MSSLGHINQTNNEADDEDRGFLVRFNDLRVLDSASVNENFDTGSEFQFNNVILETARIDKEADSNTNVPIYNPFTDRGDSNLSEISDYFRLTVKLVLGGPPGNANQGFRLVVVDSDGVFYNNSQPGSYDVLHNINGLPPQDTETANDFRVTLGVDEAMVLELQIEVFSNPSFENSRQVMFVYSGTGTRPQAANDADRIVYLQGAVTCNLLPSSESTLREFVISFANDSSDDTVPNYYIYKLEAH